MPKALYAIRYLFPRVQMGGAGFSILLYPEIKREVVLSGIKQKDVDQWIKNFGGPLLEGCGFTSAEKVQYRIQAQWGSWGLEHITVPGNACGLDIDRSGSLSAPRDGMCLSPHNVDSVPQAHLLLCIYTGIMDRLINTQQLRDWNRPERKKSKCNT